MTAKRDSPRVYIPPPLVYAGIFLISFLLQKFLPINNSFFTTSTSTIIGISFIVLGLILDMPAIRQFVTTKNTLVTIKPATTLVTSGIYTKSRNPMYLGLLLIYAGVALIIGNWWTIILIPVLISIVAYFIIKPEERYLERAFGKDYLNYKQEVRRWI
ncbi:MAG: methyltransferase family protein [Chitinophagaceae bacterium]